MSTTAFLETIGPLLTLHDQRLNIVSLLELRECSLSYRPLSRRHLRNQLPLNGSRCFECWWPRLRWCENTSTNLASAYTWWPKKSAGYRIANKSYYITCTLCTCLEQSSNSCQGCTITSVFPEPPEDLVFRTDSGVTLTFIFVLFIPTLLTNSVKCPVVLLTTVSLQSLHCYK